MTVQPIPILGGGPVGLALALLLARRHVSSLVLDARSGEQASGDRRVLALSRGTLEALATVAELPRAALAAISTVVVSSRGEFGRVVIDAAELDGKSLGATVRYGTLVSALEAACARQSVIDVRRACSVASVRQMADGVEIQTADGAAMTAAVAVNAEGIVNAAPQAPAAQWALVGDVEVEGPAAGTAFERFTRDGPLALLPLPGGATAPRPMSLVWCMPCGEAQRRERLPAAALLGELQAELGVRNARVHAISGLASYPLLEQAREQVREHRIVYVGNAAQTLHPVAGQGLNLGVRDCMTLADLLAQAFVAGEDPLSRLAAYERARRADRAVLRALTGSAPALFATRVAPLAAARSLGLTLLSIFPDLRSEFARLLMFGVRS